MKGSLWRCVHVYKNFADILVDARNISCWWLSLSMRITFSREKQAAQSYAPACFMRNPHQRWSVWWYKSSAPPSPKGHLSGRAPRGLCGGLMKTTSPINFSFFPLQLFFFYRYCFWDPSHINASQANVCLRVCFLTPNMLQLLPRVVLWNTLYNVVVELNPGRWQWGGKEEHIIYIRGSADSPGRL